MTRCSPLRAQGLYGAGAGGFALVNEDFQLATSGDHNLAVDMP